MQPAGKGRNTKTKISGKIPEKGADKKNRTPHGRGKKIR